MRHNAWARACCSLALLLAAAGGLERVAGDSLSEGTRVDPRMLLVGGRDAPQDRNRYPYLTRIHFLLDPEHGAMAGCGGTLISRRVVLTAAHCTALSRDGGANVFLRVGAYNALLDEALGHPYELRQAVKVKSHPEYVNRAENEPTAPHDIALLLLDAPVSPDFPTVALANESTPYPADDEQLYALGWGALDPHNSRPAFSMQDLGLPAVGREQCRRQWGYAGAGDGLVGEGHICAGLQSQRNICFGDSGGPLLLRGGGAGSDLQIGLTSFTFPTCALPGMPSVFTFIPHYRQGLRVCRQWIDEMVAKLDPPPPPPQPPSPPPQLPMPPKPQQVAPAEQAPAPQQEQPAAEAAAAAAAPAKQPAREAEAVQPAIVQPSTVADQRPPVVAAAAADAQQLGIEAVEAVSAPQPAAEPAAPPLVEPAPAAAAGLASTDGGQAQALDAAEAGASAEGPAAAAEPEEPLAATLEPASGSSRR